MTASRPGMPGASISEASLRRSADAAQPGRVDDDVGAGADRIELRALAPDAVGDVGLRGASGWRRRVAL